MTYKRMERQKGKWTGPDERKGRTHSLTERQISLLPFSPLLIFRNRKYLGNQQLGNLFYELIIIPTHTLSFQPLPSLHNIQYPHCVSLNFIR